MSDSNSVAVLEMLSSVFTFTVELEDVPYIVYNDSMGRLTLWDRAERLGHMYVEDVDVTGYPKCKLTKAKFKRLLKANGAKEHFSQNE